MKKFKWVFLLAIILISCKKYEEGPSLSFRSPEKRLCGKWKVEKTLYGETDQTEVYHMLGLDEFTFNIFSDWSDRMYINVSNSGDHAVAQSELGLSKDKTTLNFSMNVLPEYETDARRILEFYPVFCFGYDWKIIRLKNDEFAIRTEFENSNYEIRFYLVADFTSLN